MRAILQTAASFQDIKNGVKCFMKEAQTYSDVQRSGNAI